MLEVRGLLVRFGGLAAVNDLSFTVEPKTIVALIGPNGAGKTTALNAISGFQGQAGGEVRFEGRRISGLAPERIAALGLTRTFQQTKLFGGATVRECLLIAQHLRMRRSLTDVFVRPARVAAAEREARETAERILVRMGLTGRADERAASLAYGEQRRLGVAVALAAGPRLLLLDEPTAGMNQAEKESITDLLVQLRNEGLTIVLVEHDMQIVMEASDRVVVVHHGQKIADDVPAVVRRDAAVIDAYLGRGFAGAGTSRA